MKENFRPESILPTLHQKLFEKCVFAQMSTFFDNIFSNQQCGFRIRIQYSTFPSRNVENMEEVCR